MNQALNILHQRKAPKRTEVCIFIFWQLWRCNSSRQMHTSNLLIEFQTTINIIINVHVKLIFDWSNPHSSNAQVHVLLVPRWFYFSPRSGLNVPWGNIFWPPTQIFAVFQSDLFFMHMWQHWLEINNSEPIYKRNANKVKKLFRLKPSQNAIP